MWVCLCHRVWSAYVYRLTAVPTFHAPEKKKERKKEGCLFSDVRFQAKKFHGRCSFQAARRGWRAARLSSPIRVFFPRKMWEPSLFTLGSTFAGDRDLSY